MKPLLLFLGTVNAIPGGTGVENPPANTGDARDVGSIPGSRRFMEKEVATRSSVLAWKLPWTEEAGRLQTMGSQRVRHY